MGPINKKRRSRPRLNGNRKSSAEETSSMTGIFQADEGNGQNDRAAALEAEGEEAFLHFVNSLQPVERGDDTSRLECLIQVLKPELDALDAEKPVPAETIISEGVEVVHDQQLKGKLVEGRISQGGELPSSWTKPTFFKPHLVVLDDDEEMGTRTVDTVMTHTDQKKRSAQAQDDAGQPSSAAIPQQRRSIRKGVARPACDGDAPKSTQVESADAIPVEGCIGGPIPDQIQASNPEKVFLTLPAPKTLTPKKYQRNNTSKERDPSKEPEGSLLHSLYLLVLGYGQDGISMEEVCDEGLHQMSRIPDNWEEEVVAILKRNPYFKKVNGSYYLSDSSRLSKRSSKIFAKPGSNDNELSLTIHSDSNQGMLTRTRAKCRAFHEASLRESPVESPMQVQKKMSQQTVNADGSNDTLSLDTPLGSKPPLHHRLSKENALQSGVQTGVICSRTDVLCTMPAMAGQSLCQHHHERMSTRELVAKTVWVQVGGVRCTSKVHGGGRCIGMAMEGKLFCAHHYARARSVRIQQHYKSMSRKLWLSQDLDLMPGTGSRPENHCGQEGKGK